MGTIITTLLTVHSNGFNFRLAVFKELQKIQTKFGQTFSLIFLTEMYYKPLF